jgi:hypothetical protein
MYKFIRINEGPLRGCYHHPKFERNRFDLIEKINRTGDTNGSSEWSRVTGATNVAAAKKKVTQNMKNAIALMFNFDIDASPGKPPIILPITPRATSHHLVATMSKMSKAPGLFDLRHDAVSPVSNNTLTSQSAVSVLPATKPQPQATNSLSIREATAQNHSPSSSSPFLLHLLRNSPQDVLEEIIKTFGNHQASPSIDKQ